MYLYWGQLGKFSWTNVHLNSCPQLIPWGCPWLAAIPSMHGQWEQFSDPMDIPTVYLVGQNHLDCSVLQISASLWSHAESFGLCRYARGLTLNTLWPRSFPYAHRVSWEGKWPFHDCPCWRWSAADWGFLWEYFRTAVGIAVAWFENHLHQKDGWRSDCYVKVQALIRDEFCLCWRKLQNDPWFREVKILLKLFKFHSFNLPKWHGEICLGGNQLCHVSYLWEHCIQYMHLSTSEYASWHFWQNSDCMDCSLKVTKNPFKLNENINITSTTQIDVEAEALKWIKLILNFVDIFCN